MTSFYADLIFSVLVSVLNTCVILSGFIKVLIMSIVEIRISKVRKLSYLFQKCPKMFKFWLFM